MHASAHLVNNSNNAMFDFLKEQKGTGAMNDPRSEREQARDFAFGEVVKAPEPVKWVRKTEEQWRKFPIYDQNGSGSCVAQTAAKLLGVSYWLNNRQYVHFSATDIYQQRLNKPSGGMAASDVFKIISKNGATLEELVPSQMMTDAQMDGTEIPEYKREVGRVFKVSNYLAVPVGDIDAVASIIQKTGKAVMVWFYFVSKEWTTTPTIVDTTLTNASAKALRHSVTAVDFTLTADGKKALIIEDSWGPGYGKGGRRVVTEDFFKKRNFYAGYLMNFSFDAGKTEKPHHRFATEMRFGQTSPEIRILQDILKYEGLFPTNTDSTGYYGGVTAYSVLAFQKKYKVASDVELNNLQGMVVGEKTLTKLNQLYG